MPSFFLTIEDSSPLISYSPQWTPGTSADEAAFHYSQSTFQATQSQGATASLTFNGTGIQIVGAKRDNHGQYQVHFDNTVSTPQSGQSDTSQFQVVLFEVHGLPQGKHDVSIMNMEAQKFLDIDFITIEGDLGDDKQHFINTIQDSDSSFSYTPAESQWTTNPTNLGTYLGSSGHATSNPGSQVAFTFSGDGVSLYGPKSQDGSPYTVELDGTSPQTYTTVGDRYIPQSLLYHATNLGEGQHQLVIKYQPTSSGQVFAVDYAQVYTTRGAISTAASGGSNFSIGIVIGIILVISCVLGVVIAVVWIILRQRKRPAKLGVQETKESNMGTIQPFYDQQVQQSRDMSKTLTHSRFGPGHRPMSSDSFDAPMGGGLTVNTNMNYGENDGLRSDMRYNNRLGLSTGPVSPAASSADVASFYDTSSDAHPVGPDNSTAPRRLQLGTNGYPLVKAKVHQPEPAEDSPVAGWPFAVGAVERQPGPSSSDVRDFRESDGRNPPDYAHAMGGRGRGPRSRRI